MAIQRVKVASGAEAPRAGSMKDFVFAGEGDDAVKVLITNVGGKFSATSAKCTHYGAPLANGILTSKGKIVCPWHGACFDAKTGDIEEAPALDNLLSLKLEQDNDGNIFVEADAEKLKGKPGVPVSCKKSNAGRSSNGGFVIIGGGSAGINAIESARKAGYDGRISLFTAEQSAPLDRTKLSKALIDSADKLIWRDEKHLQEALNVDFKQGVRANFIDVEKKEVHLDDGSKVQFENLMLATGGLPKRLPLPGAKEGELENVFTLRHVDDVQNILKALGNNKDKNLVIVGTSFIGMEVAIAAAGQEKAKKVSVIGMESVPFENTLGKQVGEGLMKAQQKKGIEFYNKAGVEKLQGGENGQVASVVIKNESGKQVTIDADVVLLGVGVGPATEYLKNSKGFPELLKDGSVAVDKSLRVKGISNDANVFACGDIATVPARSQDGATVRIEHWNVAGNHGRTVGKIVAGQNTTYDDLPVFWSALGAQLRYVSDGNPPDMDDVYVDGNPEELKFAAYYAKNGKVKAVCTMAVDPLMVHSAELMRTGKMPSLNEIKKGGSPFSIPLSSL